VPHLLNEYSKCGYLNSIPGANNEVMGFVWFPQNTYKMYLECNGSCFG